MARSRHFLCNLRTFPTLRPWMLLQTLGLLREMRLLPEFCSFLTRKSKVPFLGWHLFVKVYRAFFGLAFFVEALFFMGFQNLELRLLTKPGVHKPPCPLLHPNRTVELDLVLVPMIQISAFAFCLIWGCWAAISWISK